nr:VCBS repeat-containing protein [Acidobacteriota bacterium]
IYYFTVRGYDINRLVSPPSNEVVFTTPAACTFGLSSSTQEFGPAGGASGVTLTTSDSCRWSVGTNASWLTLNSASLAGTGPRALGYTVARNVAKNARVGIIYSGNRSVTVVQQGRSRSDFNGDGLNDLVWQNDKTGALSVWRMKGTTLDRGEFLTPSTTGDPKWKLMGTLDADRDGNVDLLLQHDDGRVAIWRMAGETRIENVALTNSVVADPLWRIVATGDMDSDEIDDIIWQHKDGRVNVWYMNGLQMRQSALLATVSDARWRVASIDDYNDDGKLDILWRHTSWGQLLVWHMDNRQYLSHGMAVTMANSQWEIVASADFNGDRKTDLIWRNNSTGEMATWFLSDGDILDSQMLNPERVGDISWRIAGPR